MRRGGEVELLLEVGSAAQMTQLITSLMIGQELIDTGNTPIAYCQMP